MSSYFANPPVFFHHNFPATQHDSTPHINTTNFVYPIANNDCAYYDESTIYSHAISLLRDTAGTCMNSSTTHPNSTLESSNPTSLSPTYHGRQDSVVTAFDPSGQDWQQMYQSGMGGQLVSNSTGRPFKRARTHQRTPSASTVASNGPASPYTANTSYPHVANTDYSPNSSAHYATESTASFFSKPLPTPQPNPTDGSFLTSGYIPSQAAHMPNAHLAMKSFGIDHHLEDFVPDFYHSSRHSMSSGYDSPATPQSCVGDHNDLRGLPSTTQNDYKPVHANLPFFRTESSQAYQDELYNPAIITSTPASVSKRPSADYLSPHRNLVTERLQTANMARSASPTSAMSRERSPFRDGSPLAPAGDWGSSGHMRSAAGMRQQQKEQDAQAEYDQHVPTLRREPTKTISPKDALLEYHDTDQAPLFHEQIPAGYKQHTSSGEDWQQYVGQNGSTFGNLSAPTTSAEHMTTYRTTVNEPWQPEANYYLPPANHGHSQIQSTPFQSNTYAAPRMDFAEQNPQFPPQLTSMESSVSESGPPLSSQSSFNAPAIQRPLDTRANTGTYTCTYHGCTERFNTHIDLQRHKREFHRSHQHKDSTSTPTGTDSTSPRSTESPAPSSSGLTSAAILARNSQAGPHKCGRTNPSTGKPCNTIFSRPYDLTRHEDTIHNNRKQKVRCPMCREEKTFSRNDALTRHMRVVHPEVESFAKRSRRGD